MTDTFSQTMAHTTSAILTRVEVSKLKPHPKNPRLFMRDDVIEGLVAGLKDGFKEKHALHVRPVDDGFEVVSGHHRLAAAVKSEITHVPCWVEEMDDDTAYMELVKANNQGELLPIEIGIHALEKVGKAQGKRTKGDGLAGYAEEVGRSKVSITEWVAAAEVYSAVVSTCEQLKDKPRHLYEISKAPESAWPVLVECLIDSDWSVKDVKAAVDRVKQVSFPEFIDIDLQGIYRNIALNPAEGKKIKQCMDMIAGHIDSLIDSIELYEHIKSDEIEIIDGREYYKMLPKPLYLCIKSLYIKNLRESASYFDLKSIQKIYKDICLFCNAKSDQSIKYEPVLTDAEIERESQRKKELEIIARREFFTPKLIHGDALTELRKLGNESVNLICIDPPYNMDKADWDSYGSGVDFANWCETWLKECYRVLKSDGAIYVFGINRMLSHIQHRMDTIGFYYRNWITWDTIQGAGGGLWVNRQENILYYSKTSSTFEDADSVKLERSEENVREYKGKEYQFKNPSNIWRFPCVDSQHEDRTIHPTQKPVELIERIIKASCPDDGVVLDCFMGSGTTGVAAMKNMRRSIGIEMNKDYIDIAESRFSDVEIA